MENTPLVSVIMPAYNSAPFIEDSIQSVLSQTYSRWELFVIDDASIDATARIAEDLAEKDPRIKLLQLERNQGTGAARNKGIDAANGAFIAFLDADDLWLPEKLEVQLEFLLENDLAMTFSSYFIISEDGSLLDIMVEALPVLTYQKLLKSNYVGNLTGIYNVEKTGKVYSPLLRKRQDWAMWLTILRKAGKVEGMLEPLAMYRKRKNSLSQNKAALIVYNFNVYRQFLQFGFFKSCKYLLNFLWEHFFIKKAQLKSSSGL